MGSWLQSKDDYENVHSQPNEAKLSHEALAGAGAFAAMHVFEERQRKNGQPVTHEFAKEFLVGLAGFEVDRLFETKGRDAYDNYEDRKHAQDKAKEQAANKAVAMYDDHYQQQGSQWSPDSQPPEYIDHERYNNHQRRERD